MIEIKRHRSASREGLQELANGSPVSLAKTALKHSLIEVRKFGRLERITNVWSNKDLLLEIVRPTYGDPDNDQPPPPDLFRFIREQHQWDIDL